MRPFRQVNMILPVEQPLYKTFELLLTDERKFSEIPRGRIHGRTDQPKWRAALLVFGQVIPQTVDQGADQLIHFVNTVKFRSSPPHRPLTTCSGETPITGVAMLPRKRVRTS